MGEGDNSGWLKALLGHQLPVRSNIPRSRSFGLVRVFEHVEAVFELFLQLLHDALVRRRRVRRRPTLEILTSGWSDGCRKSCPIKLQSGPNVVRDSQTLKIFHQWPYSHPKNCPISGNMGRKSYKLIILPQMIFPSSLYALPVIVQCRHRWT